MLKFFKRFVFVIVVVGLGLWAANSSLLVSQVESHKTRVIAHRGVHHIYTGSDRSVDSCHASPVEPIEHRFIENTLPSMREAFRLGADVVEIDVHLTNDNVFAVFHDWTVDCRTDGTGVTHNQNLTDLQALDLGYRIDDGSGSFPLRGQAIGQMPDLLTVLSQDMGGAFLVNFKSTRRGDGVALLALLENPELRERVYGVYGGSSPTQAVIDAPLGLRGFDKAMIKSCLMRYFAIGWSGYVPEVCRDTMIVVPQNYAGFLWGWPHRFTRRLGDKGTDVIIAGPYDGSGFISGIDDATTLANVPEHFDGYIWTNRIELVGPTVSSDQ